VVPEEIEETQPASHRTALPGPADRAGTDPRKVRGLVPANFFEPRSREPSPNLRGEIRRPAVACPDDGGA